MEQSKGGTIQHLDMESVSDWNTELKHHCPESIDTFLDDVELFLNCAEERRVLAKQNIHTMSAFSINEKYQRSRKPMVSGASAAYSTEVDACRNEIIARAWINRAFRDLQYLARLADESRDIDCLDDVDRIAMFEVRKAKSMKSSAK